MDAAQAGQVTRSAADVYEEFFVPALFQGWAAPVCEVAGLRPGQRVPGRDTERGTREGRQDAARGPPVSSRAFGP